MSDNEETEIKARTSAPKHAGTRESHGAYKAQHYAWCVGEGFDETVYGKVDESLYPQRMAAKTITAIDDPRGPAGTVLPAEDDDSRVEIAKEEEKHAWAATLKELRGEALRAGMRAHKGSCRDLIKQLDAEFGAQTLAQIVELLIKFLSCEKTVRRPSAATLAHFWSSCKSWSRRMHSTRRRSRLYCT